MADDTSKAAAWRHAIIDTLDQELSGIDIRDSEAMKAKAAEWTDADCDEMEAWLSSTPPDGVSAHDTMPQCLERIVFPGGRFKATDEPARRQRLADALPSLPAEVRVLGFDVEYHSLFISLTPLADGTWQATHDHDPDEHDGHVTACEAATPGLALVACVEEADRYDDSQYEDDDEGGEV